jgi:hypothetical protein
VHVQLVAQQLGMLAIDHADVADADLRQRLQGAPDQGHGGVGDAPALEGEAVGEDDGTLNHGTVSGHEPGERE